MKKKILPLILFSLALTSCNEANISYQYELEEEANAPKIIEQEEISNKDPFTNIGIYTDPELDLDGVRNEEYDYPMGSGRHLVYSSENETTYCSIYKGEKAIYFLFEAADNDISTINVEDINLVTAQSDSCELYVSTYGTGGKGRSSLDYEFRITAAGKVYSYLTGFVAKVFDYGTINNHKDVDTGFNIEGYISYDVLGSDVNKYTPTSFAFARVTKTGSFGYVWHGDVDPQIPDNYLVLHTDNKFYKLDACPVSGNIKGKLVDINNNPVSSAKVSIPGVKSAYTNSSGEYNLEVNEISSDIEIEITKKDYLSYKTTISKNELRNASNHELALNTTFLKEAEKSYKTTLKGTLYERDGVTPIRNADIIVNDSSTKTNNNGEYEFIANLEGYSNIIKYSDDTHITYEKEIKFNEVNINKETNIIPISLDENYGDEIDFGNSTVGYATARAYREENSFKLVLKTTTDMDLNDYLGSNFEVFIDTKESASYEQRDETDYRFDLAYSEQGLIDEKNYGNKPFVGSGIKTTYGRINELYYVEADINYSYINVTKDEVFGLYFGIKFAYNWAGMYEKGGNYIKAEAPINYVRLNANSKFIAGSINTLPDVSGYKEIGRVGSNDLYYDVSAARCQDGVMLKLVAKDGFILDSESHSLNIYADMNANNTKNSIDEDYYHISIYPGRPVSHYNYYDTKKQKESSDAVYEEIITDSWTCFYDNTIYVKLYFDILSGTSNNTIGFAIGCWIDKTSSNNLLKYQNKTPDFAKPSSYIMMDEAGQLLIN